MMDLYTDNTSNGHRVAIMLEECEIEYQVHKVNLRRGEQKQARFLKLNPSGRIPVIVDHDESVVLSQSVAILLYLSDKTEKFIPKDMANKAKMLEWLCFHATDIATTSGNIFYLNNSEWLGYRDAVQRLNDRIYGWYKHFDQQLSKHQYLAGDDYTIADITVFPSIMSNDMTFFEQYKHMARWRDDLLVRPAVQRGLSVI